MELGCDRPCDLSVTGVGKPRNTEAMEREEIGKLIRMYFFFFKGGMLGNPRSALFYITVQQKGVIILALTVEETVVFVLFFVIMLSMTQWKR